MILGFVRFREVNDWEGETWNFWLQVTNNEDELSKFMGMLNSAEAASDSPDDFPFQFFPGDVLTEEQVDLLVEFSEEGYMASHNKVTGTFSCPDEIDPEGWWPIYKGNIREFFRD